MSLTEDVAVKYVNATGNLDFHVVVFTKNFSANTPRSYYFAWQVLKTKSSAQFVHPNSVSVGATYKKEDQERTCEMIMSFNNVNHFSTRSIPS